MSLSSTSFMDSRENLRGIYDFNILSLTYIFSTQFCMHVCSSYRSYVSFSCSYICDCWITLVSSSLSWLSF